MKMAPPARPRTSPAPAWRGLARRRRGTVATTCVRVVRRSVNWRGIERKHRAETVSGNIERKHGAETWSGNMEHGAETSILDSCLCLCRSKAPNKASSTPPLRTQPPAVSILARRRLSILALRRLSRMAWWRRPAAAPRTAPPPHTAPPAPPARTAARARAARSARQGSGARGSPRRTSWAR